MGCCFSAGKTEQRHSIDGSPPTSPPCVLEEETVKEVLLETPVVSNVDESIKGMPPEWKVEAESTPVIHRNSYPARNDNEEIVCEVSEVSEMCSYSESLSHATAEEKRDDDDDGVVNQRPPPRKRRAQAGGRGIGRRAGAPLPEKRGQVAPLRPVRGRPTEGQPRNVAEENWRRRDPGEGSGRMSRSPVRRGEVGDRRDASDEKSPATEEPPNDVVSAEEAESLENPVVSLECFIFL